MMSPEAMRKWIADLRSGEYQQMHGNWVNDKKNPTAFCCLSVALHTSGQLTIALADAMMFGRVATMLGLEYADAIDLCGLNDGKMMNFSEIADHIERVLLPKAERFALTIQ